MKIKVYNYDKISENAINDSIVRVKALIINSKDEILLAEAFKTVQFPGGHVEEDESLRAALKREVLEETGISINEDYIPFFAIKYFLKDYPVIGNNRSIEIYYFYIFTDELYTLENMNIDDQERKGNFKLCYVPLKKFKKYLRKNEANNPINRIVNREMLLAMKELKKHKRL